MIVRASKQYTSFLRSSNYLSSKGVP